MQPLPRTATQLVSQAKLRIENLTPDQVAAELARGDVLLVDLRETEERAQRGAIPGAVHAPRGMLESYADPTDGDHRSEFDPSRRTILYCAGGARSALAAETLQQLGYARVAHLEGGFTAWTASRHETTLGQARELAVAAWGGLSLPTTRSPGSCRATTSCWRPSCRRS
jgi:rhodanese-related sulfurtransferase